MTGLLVWLQQTVVRAKFRQELESELFGGSRRRAQLEIQTPESIPINDDVRGHGKTVVATDYPRESSSRKLA